MILSIGKFGIIEIRGEYRQTVSKIIIHKNMNIETIQLNNDASIRINNILINFDNFDKACHMFDIIHEIYIGSRYDKLKRIMGDD